MRRRLCLVTFASVALLAGCGGSDEVSAKKLPQLVLRDGDLGPPFAQVTLGRQTSSDNAGARSDTTRFGRKGGWIARYNRPGSPKTRGPLVVESRADVFAGARGAKRDLALYRDQFGRVAGADRRLIKPRRLGDAAVGVTFLQAGVLPVRFYSIAWRDGNVTAAVTVNGFARRLRMADAVALARKQDRRIARER